MSRVLEFRAWDTLEKRFIFANKGYQGHFILDLNGQFYNLQNGSGGKEYVVQQFTGLKDKNDKKIFEGDILIWHSNNGRDYKSPVVFSPTSAAFVLDTSRRHLLDDKYGDHLDLHRDREYEIVGNVFETPNY